jgi:histidyl-tRNA synthetase
MLPDSVVSPTSPLVFVAAFGQQGLPLGVRVLDQLRNLGITADTDYRAMTLKGHLRQADRLGASFVVIIGDDEASKRRLLLRNMATKDQEEVPVISITEVVSARVKSYSS